MQQGKINAVDLPKCNVYIKICSNIKYNMIYATLKGTCRPKMKICDHLLTFMLLQTHRILVNLQNTNWVIFYETRETSIPPPKVQETKTCFIKFD